MDRSEIAVATMTWARDAAESELLRASLAELAALGMPVAAADGGSGAEFVEGARALRNFRVLEVEKPGVVAQTTLSLRAAAEEGRPYILYTESDKGWFFRERLAEFVAAAPAGAGVGVVLAARSPASFETYPASQRYCESVINRLCAETTGAEADYSYGPLIVARELLPCLEHVGADVGWGWRHFLFGAAHRLGYRVVTWIADLPCPEAQREDTPAERLHRMRQLSENVRGLALALSIPEENLSAPAEM